SGEGPLVDVMVLVGRCEHLGLVDVVDLQGLEDLCLHEMTDPGFGHHGDRHGLLDLLDLRRVGHSGDTAMAADVGRNPLECHHGDRTCLLGDASLLGGDDVHDDAALEHLGQTTLDQFCSSFHGYSFRPRMVVADRVTADSYTALYIDVTRLQWNRRASSRAASPSRVAVAGSARRSDTASSNSTASPTRTNRPESPRTARNAGRSDATTAQPAAMASAITIPKLSPPRLGATITADEPRICRFSWSLTLPRKSTPSTG